MRKNSKAFTLVELIVVITILAILGTIAFLSFQGYSSDARDSTRTTDLSSIKTSLELFNTKVGGYPLPTSYTGVTYSGGLVWNQGTFGIDPFKQVGNISKVPLDPLTSNEYTYSITNTKGEYEIAVVYEGALAKNKNILNQANAGSLQGNVKIMGSYNGVYVMTNTGGTNFTIFVPTIINGDMSVLDLPSIISGGKIVVMGGTKLPDSYKNSNFKNEDFSTQIGSNIIISTGSLSDLKAKNGTALRQEFLDNLKTILSGTTVENNYKELINTTSDTLALNLVSGKWKANIYNGAVASNFGVGGGGGGGGGNTLSNCTTQGQILDANSTYGSCSLPDKIICAGAGAGIVISSCNVGTNVSGTGSSSYGNYYQFGRNKGFTMSSSTSSTPIPGTVNSSSDTYDFITSYNWSTDNVSDNWGGVSNNSILSRGPCETGYHIPTQDEWANVINFGNSTWGNDGNIMGNSLNMPFGGYRDFDGNPQNVSSAGEYWSTNPYWSDGYSLIINNYIYNSNSHSNSSGLNLRCFKDYPVSNSNTVSNCINQGQILTSVSTYGSCDSPDIIVCSGFGAGNTVSSCNVGTNISGTGSSSYGNYFQWGRNKGFTTSSATGSTQIPGTVNSSTDTYDLIIGNWSWSNDIISDNWGGVSNNSILSRGPCESGYHVPSQNEWNTVINSSSYDTGTDGYNMRNTFKLPFSGYIYHDNGTLLNETSLGRYWTIEEYSGFGGYNLEITSSSISTYSSNSNADGQPIRCFKD